MIKKFITACIAAMPLLANAYDPSVVDCKTVAVQYYRFATLRDNGISIKVAYFEIRRDVHFRNVSPNLGQIEMAIAKDAYTHRFIDPTDFYQIEYSECMKR